MNERIVMGALILILLSVYSLSAVITHNPYSLYLWAQYNQGVDATNKGIGECYDILLAEGHLKDIYPGYFSYLSDTKQHKRLIESADAIKIEDPNIELLVAQALEATGNTKKADQLLFAMAQKHQDRADVMYYAVGAYMRLKQPKKALELVDTYLSHGQDTSKNFLFHFLKAQLLGQTGNYKEALPIAQKVTEMNPTFEQGWLLLGLLSEQLGKTQEAMMAYQKATKMGDNPVVERQLKQLTLRKQINAASVQQELANKALLLFEQQEYKASLELANKCLAIGDHPTAKLIKIEVLCRLGRVEDALDWIKQWIEINPQSEHWFKALEVLHQAGARTPLIEQTLLDLEKRVVSPLPSFYLGKLYVRAGSKDKALASYQKALHAAKDAGQLQTIERAISSVK